MLKRSTTILTGAAALGLASLVACSDSSGTTGPGFGDLEFTPSFENIGSGRSLELTLTNASTAAQGPIFVGLDALFETASPDSLCSSIKVNVTPAQIASLASNADAAVSVSIDTQNVDNVDCPPAQYDADIYASVDGRILGGATVRFDWTGTPP
ncbi:MAG: hypothetical protein PVF05_10930 [Gemmatimonadales bacterium]|jgi:hypothetical protein